MREINHLYWRAGFGIAPHEWEQYQNLSRSKAVNQLFNQAQENFSQPVRTVIADGTDPKKLSKDKRQELVKAEQRKVADVIFDWYSYMGDSNYSPLLERMTLFWHGHFACRSRSGKLAANQINAIRKHALGDFRSLLVAISKDPSMIRYLNNQQNRKGKPNENFARELMELFTIGRGNYSENDIKEAARAFTGWMSNFSGEYVFRPFFHDYGQKTFMGKKGNFDGTDIIDIILENKATALYITNKIYKYFVNSTPDEAIVKSLADQFYHSNYNISGLMRTIFESDWFYSKKNMGHKFKSPVDLVAGLMKTMDLKFEQTSAMVFVHRSLGQTLFNPPNVAGWPGGKAWIDNSTLLLRLNIVPILMTSKEVNLRTKDEFEARQRSKATKRIQASINLDPMINLLGSLSDNQIHDYLKEYLLLSPSKTNEFMFRRLAADASDRNDLVKRSMLFFCSLPEYQLC